MSAVHCRRGLGCREAFCISASARLLLVTLLQLSQTLPQPPAMQSLFHGTYSIMSVYRRQ